MSAPSRHQREERHASTASARRLLARCGSCWAWTFRPGDGTRADGRGSSGGRSDDDEGLPSGQGDLKEYMQPPL